jgi:dihydroxy-acid dehydratase
MGTASTMANLTEVMGLCLPKSGSAPATDAERIRLAEQTGRLAGRIASEGGPTVRELLTPAALRNAMVALQAMGGSTNAVVHLAAICGRLGMPLDTEELNEIGKRMPLLVDLQPSGQHYMPQFHQAGGVPALLKAIKGELDISARTIHGKTLGDIIDEVVDEPSQTIIRTVDKPLKPIGTLAILKGNLAPRGAVIKQSAASPALLKHRGRAVVFETVADLSERIDSDDLDVTADDVLVLRNAGPKGAPGMPEAGFLPIPRKLARQGVKDMVRISDARMSGTAYGTVVLHIAPEAADNGPLAIVRNGDIIALDVAARTIDLEIAPEEFERRIAALPARSTGGKRGYDRLYHEHVVQADEGADFDFMRNV